MEKSQYRITQRLKTQERYAAVSKSAKDNLRSMNDEINFLIDKALKLTNPSKSIKK